MVIVLKFDFRRSLQLRLFCFPAVPYEANSNLPVNIFFLLYLFDIVFLHTKDDQNPFYVHKQEQL
jgi:hypothetical protein